MGSPGHPPIPVPPPPPGRGVAAERRKKARRNLAWILAAVAVTFGALWWIERTSSLPFANIASLGNSIANEISQGFSSYPAPLSMVTNTSKKNAKLTRAGVIADTNVQRQDNSLPPLKENSTLDDIAILRLDDMFEHQYFAHVSPTGESAESVASSVGYMHLALGENLAEGIFAGDQGVVDAWMASPGHRANILNTHYDQIGVAVREGTYQGRDAWIAVQVFGRPASDCPAPSAALKSAIDIAETQLAEMDAELTAQRAEIDAIQPKSGSAYNQSVQQYNDLVGRYNALIGQAKAEITQYNTEINSFNQCLEG